MIAGIDISHRNGLIDWDLLQNSDIHFVFIQATEAVDSIDHHYSANIQSAKKANLMTGSYHWLHPRLHVGQQAELFASTVKDFKESLPPVVCLEKHRSKEDEMEKNVRSFLLLVEKKLGVKPIIYTSEAYWQRFFSGATWGCDYLLWLDKPGSVFPNQIYPWASWTFWQQSYQERLPGIQTECGINWFNGSLDELRQMVIQ